MKFDPNTTTIGDLMDDPEATKALNALVPNPPDIPIDDFVRNMTFADASIYMKQMFGAELFDKVVETLNALNK